MLAPVSLFLLGGFRAERNGEPITAFESNKVRALLAYLAVEAGRPHQRSALAGLLWPDHPEELARTNLRHVLRQLRQTLPGQADASPLLLTSQQTIQLNPSGAAVLDVAQFAELLAASARCQHSALSDCPECVERYSRAAALYHGPFLAGFDLHDSDIFDEWAVTQREQLHRQVLEIFFTLASHYEGIAEYDLARQYAWRQIELEPWREESHRQLMRVLALSGQRTAALSQYAQCRAILADELGVEPDAETVALYEAIRTGKLRSAPRSRAATPQASPPPAAASRTPAEAPQLGVEHAFPGSALGLPPLSPLPPASGARSSELALRPEREAPAQPEQTSALAGGMSTPLQDWGEMPATAYFYGRQAELAQLGQWLIDERRRLVLVLGMGGMGKTTIVAKAAKSLAEQFDAVFWRSLLNAPPLPELLRDCLIFLSRQQLVALPDSLNAQLAMLFDYLRQQRCLLIFDNLESILEAGQAGHYRPGYAEYGQLFERMARTEHRSSLVLTSRERPQGLQRLAEDSEWVYVLPLDGLEEQAAQALLKTRGLGDSTEVAASLVERYSGNPLALKLVARTIQELFDGDIAAFLSDQTLIFDDIRTVLDQQFARLSRLERAILIWLAVEREGLSLDDLAQELLSAPSRRDLLEALRALQRRSLLEKIDTGFILQNVVMEYVTDVVVERAYQEIESGQVDLLANHALFRAQTRQYVRQSQRRLILQPIGRRLLGSFGRIKLAERLRGLLGQLRAEAPLAPGYAAGNIFNLLVHLGADLRGYDFSRLSVWQADLRQVVAPDVDFSGADLTGCAFTGTFGLIYSLAYSPDGQFLAVGAGDGRVHLWRVSEQQPYAICHGHTNVVLGLAFSPDSRLLASSSRDSTVRVWDTHTGQPLHTLAGHSGWVCSVAFSPDGQLLASGSNDQSVRVWHVRDRQAQHTLLGHTDWVRSVAFSPDGRSLASGGADGTIRVWSAADGQARYVIAEQTKGVASIAFSPDGRTLASGGGDRIVRLWDAETGQERGSLSGHTGEIQMVAFTPDNTTLASGSTDQTVRVWNATTGTLRYTLLDHTNEVRAIALSPDGAILASASADQTVRLWDVKSGQARQTLHGYINAIWSVAFPAHLEDDSAMLASGGDDQKVRIWDLRAGKVRHALQGHVGDVLTVAFRPDGQLLASGGVDQTIRLWDARTGHAQHVLHGHAHAVWSLAFNAAGRLLVSGSEDQTIRIWDVQAMEWRHTLHGHTGAVRCVAFSPDGQLLASGSADQTICLWDVESGQVRHTLRGHTHWLRAVAFSPDGARLASVGADQTLRLWDVRSGAAGLVLHGHGDIVISVAFSPDGTTIATCGSDRTVRLWDAESGEARHILHGHSFWVRSVAFSPDGQVLASGSADETIKLWNPHTGACLQTLRAEGPYAGMKIAGVTGITQAQRAALKALGAVEM